MLLLVQVPKGQYEGLNADNTIELMREVFQQLEEKNISKTTEDFDEWIKGVAFSKLTEKHSPQMVGASAIFSNLLGKRIQIVLNDQPVPIPGATKVFNAFFVVEPTSSIKEAYKKEAEMLHASNELKHEPYITGVTEANTTAFVKKTGMAAWTYTMAANLALPGKVKDAVDKLEKNASPETPELLPLETLEDKGFQFVQLKKVFPEFFPEKEMEQAKIQDKQIIPEPAVVKDLPEEQGASQKQEESQSSLKNTQINPFENLFGGAPKMKEKIQFGTIKLTIEEQFRQNEQRLEEMMRQQELQKDIAKQELDRVFMDLFGEKQSQDVTEETETTVGMDQLRALSARLDQAEASMKELKPQEKAVPERKRDKVFNKLKGLFGKSEAKETLQKSQDGIRWTQVEASVHNTDRTADLIQKIEQHKAEIKLLETEIENRKKTDIEIDFGYYEDAGHDFVDDIMYGSDFDRIGFDDYATPKIEPILPSGQEYLAAKNDEKQTDNKDQEKKRPTIKF